MVLQHRKAAVIKVLEPAGGAGPGVVTTPRWSCRAPGAVGAPQRPGTPRVFVDFAARGFGILADHLDLAIALLKYIYLKSELLADLLNINNVKKLNLQSC